MLLLLVVVIGISVWGVWTLFHRCGDPVGHSPPRLPGPRHDLPDPRSPSPAGTALPFRRALPSRDVVQPSGTAAATSHTGLRSYCGFCRCEEDGGD